MASRADLQVLLTSLIGSNNVYYQPPESIMLRYPCVVYRINKIQSIYADNIPYCMSTQYELTIMTRDPDSSLPKTILELVTARHERSFASDGLNHTIITLFY